MPYGNYGRGVLLKPGDSLIYGTAPGGANGFYGFANVFFARADAYVPMMRVRFPRWDTGWIGPNGMLTVQAGCNVSSCLPAGVWANVSDQSKPQRPSNDWYVVPQHTAIRGITVFGTTQMKFSIRVVQQGGIPLIAPVTIDLSTVSTFSSGQSAFIPLDIDVPQGALVGIDFTLPVNGILPGDDFAGYLWFDQRAL